MTQPQAGRIIYAEQILAVINKPIVRLIQASAQNIIENTLVALQWQGTIDDVDTHNFHNPASNNSRITPNVAGYYSVNFTFYPALASTYTMMGAAVGKNGGPIHGRVRQAFVTGGASTAKGIQCSVSNIFMNGTTDYFEGLGEQASGSTRTTLIAGSTTSCIDVTLERY